MELLEVKGLTLVRERMRMGWFRRVSERETLLEDLSLRLEREAGHSLVGDDRRALLAFCLALVKRHPIAAGSIGFAGVSVSEMDEARFRPLRRRIQAVFPDAYGQLAPKLTIEEAFREVLNVWHRKAARDERHHLVESVMIACGLPEAVRGLYPAELDAVERQQAALARALLPGPDLLVCHGLVEGLDAVQRAELVNRVRHLREEFGLALLVVGDDLAAAHLLGETLTVLHRGRIVETGSAAAVVARPRHEHTRRLVACTG